MIQNQLSTTTYGLIGYPLGHSYSKAFFTAFFAENGIPESYDTFELPELSPEAVYSLILMNPLLRGFNVTAPYKEKIMPFLDSLSDEAKAVGAVNTVRVHRDAQGMLTGMSGHNTDVAGFRESMAGFLPLLPEGSGALILGTGGAAKAVAEALRQDGIHSLFVSRTAGEGRVQYEAITPDLLSRYPLVVNATPLGTAPNVEQCPPFPYELLGPGNICHDLVYNPDETTFMRQAAERGARTKNGLEMLFAQAIESLKYWNK